MRLMSEMHLILGGSNSGKSRFAEKLALSLQKKTQGELYYIATGLAYDQEMQDKIAAHKKDRDQKFQTIDSPDLGANILKASKPKDIILIDCISMSVSNILTLDQFKKRRIDDIKSDLKKCKSNLILVGQETSLGILPTNELSRKFLRESGKLNQDIASFSNSVSLVVAGHSITLK